MSNQTVKIIGAGLAGCEAAWQLAKRGVKVKLYEMKPSKMSPAHKSENFAELVCSNSLRADGIYNAVGLLKEEMRRLGSLIMECADATRVPAGGALAVDRDGFSKMVTEKIKACPDIEIISVNPVGLKGLFRDVYTKEYVKNNPELFENVDNIEYYEDIAKQ